MIESRDRDQIEVDTLARPVQQVADRIARQLAVAVRPPHSVRVETTGSRITLWCKDRDKLISAAGLSGADHYDAYWCEDVDTSTTQGILNGLARATKVGDAQRVFVDGREVPIAITDPQFQNGFFYVVGANPLGDRSVEFCFTGKIGNEILDDALPDNVDNFTASESGETQNGTVVSAVAFQYFAPASPSFAGVQFFLGNYPNIGEVTEFYVDRYFGSPKGVSNGKFFATPCRRVGVGAVSPTNGFTTLSGASTKFLSQFLPGDVFERLGVQGIVQSITDDTHLTLTAPWSGATEASVLEWTAIGQVTVYAVPLSKAGTHADYTLARSVSTLFDADLSAPIAPNVSAGNRPGGILVLVTPPAGTQIDTITLYRGKGAGLAFAACSRIFSWPHDKIQSSPFLEYFDTDFQSIDKESAQVFSYYAVAVNVRGQASVPSSRLEQSPVLQSGQDVDPTVPGRSGYLNMLYNAMFAGTNTGNVLDTDTNQDANLFTDASNLPGRPYGGNGGQLDGTGRWKGFTRWAGTKTAGAAAVPTFQNGNEIKFPPPGAVQSCYAFQEIGAWDDAGVRGAQFAKARKNGFVAFQIKARKNGTIPTGSLFLVIEQYNNGTLLGNAKRRYRDASNNLTFYTGIAADREVVGSTLLDTWQLYYGIFQYDAVLGTTKQIRFTIERRGPGSGSDVGDIYVCDPMINDGQELGLWTAQIGDPYTSMPVPGNPPGEIGDGDGHRSGVIKVP